jgi:hypothetical protein
MISEYCATSNGTPTISEHCNIERYDLLPMATLDRPSFKILFAFMSKFQTEEFLKICGVHSCDYEECRFLRCCVVWFL